MPRLFLIKKITVFPTLSFDIFKATYKSIQLNFSLNFTVEERTSELNEKVEMKILTENHYLELMKLHQFFSTKMPLKRLSQTKGRKLRLLILNPIKNRNNQN